MSLTISHVLRELSSCVRKGLLLEAYSWWHPFQHLPCARQSTCTGGVWFLVPTVRLWGDNCVKHCISLGAAACKGDTGCGRAKSQTHVVGSLCYVSWVAAHLVQQRLDEASFDGKPCSGSHHTQLKPHFGFNKINLNPTPMYI